MGESRVVRLLVGAVCLAAACREEPVLPPELRDRAAPKAPKPDPRFQAVVRGERRIQVPNLVLVVLVDPSDSQVSGVSLTSAASAAGVPRLTLGKEVRVKTLGELAGKPIRITGGRSFMPRGNGIFAPRVSYTPRIATLTIDELTKTEARGTVTGEFYRWSTSAGAAGRSTRVELEISFVARLILR